jgi:hypothetical protein
MTSNHTQGNDPQLIPNDQAKKRKVDNVPIFSDEKDATFSRFLVVTAKDEQPIKLSIFGIQKLLFCAVGDVKEAKKLRSGSVLIEVRTKQQSETALKMTTWVDQLITVTPHRTLNTSRGIIRCREFRDCDDAEVLGALSGQGVTEIKRIKAKREGVLAPTNTIILTFNAPTPPTSVKAAYMKLDVEPFIPNPLRCFNCQKFGHGKMHCNRKARFLIMYCRASLSRRRCIGISWASTCKLGIGDVRKAPRQILKARFWTRSKGWRYESRAEPYTIQPKSSFERTSARYNLNRVALSAPQSVWATTRRRFIIFRHLSFKLWMWALKVSFRSKVRPRNLVSSTTEIRQS